MHTRIQTALQRLITEVNAELSELHRNITTNREHAIDVLAQAKERAKTWPKDPKYPFRIPKPLCQAWDLKKQLEKDFIDAAEKVAQAIFDAESAFCAECLGAFTTGEAPTSAENLVGARVSADAVLRLAAAELRGHKFEHHWEYSKLAKLIRLAEPRSEAEEDDDGRRWELFISPAIAPAISPALSPSMSPGVGRRRRRANAVEHKPELIADRVTKPKPHVQPQTIEPLFDQRVRHRTSSGISAMWEFINTPRDGFLPLKPTEPAPALDPAEVLKPTIESLRVSPRADARISSRVEHAHSPSMAPSSCMRSF